MSALTWHRLVWAFTRVCENLGVEQANAIRGEKNDALIRAYELARAELSEEIIRRLEEAERKETDNG